jgi:hypothetical protein
VTASDLDSGQPLRFVVSGNESSDTWTIEFIRESFSHRVETTVRYDGQPDDVDHHYGSSVAVDITAGTINGSDEFEFAPDVSEPYDIRIENGQHVGNGSYTITVDEHSVVDSAGFNDNRTAGNPYVTRAVETAVVDVSYGTGAVSMDTQVEVTPE